jgi:hypothetical protein
MMAGGGIVRHNRVTCGILTRFPVSGACDDAFDAFLFAAARHA